MQTHRTHFEAMASHCEVVLAGDDAQRAPALAQAAVAEVKRVEAKFSRYLADSIISRINAAAGARPVACDEETWSLLGYADSLFQTSGGLFDITSGVLRRAWNFKQPRVPTEAELQAVRALIGWGRVERHDSKVRLPEAGMEIDFGGFGKEYAADRAGAILAQQGVRHGYVNLAGDIRVIGPKPDGQPWMIGIQHPRHKGQLLATIPLGQGGLATSGDYERFFELDGQRYCHVLDPRSGRPVTHWQSVSVVAPLTVVAGNCTTIAMLKQAQGLAFLESTGMSYLAVDQQGVVHHRAQEPVVA
jgi:thiamine biosynthesis lipoprotein